MVRSEKVFFHNRQSIRLAAVVDMPAYGELQAWALFAHGFTLGKGLPAYRHISKALTAQGIAVMRFDFTGLAESEGDFSRTGFSSNVSDIIAAAEFLQQHYQSPRILIGHSLGGAAMLVAAASIPSASAVAVIAAPCDPAHITQLFAGREDEMASHGKLNVTLGGRPFVIRQQFLDDVNHASTCAATASLDKALLIMHAPGDRLVSIQHAQYIYEAARHPKSFVSLDDADHLLSNPADARYAAAVIATWAQRYL